jgi:hypothetical protein
MAPVEFPKSFDVIESMVMEPENEKSELLLIKNDFEGGMN